ncbi:hypothetical protein ABT158_47350 [Nonomuraea sp. NPDC001636]|uniref:hypothetical protein n=1 Tax=Nonomuraea sp. NPDC001636 TaxID=3154391 RepID=UPI00332E07E7
MAHIRQATNEAELEINRVLHLEADLNSWLKVLEAYPESQQLRSAHQDFGLAFYAAMSGLYRQAFSGLRSFLEVTVGTAYLSALEFKRRQWVSGRLDISWSSITSLDDGIYSTPFLREFCVEAIADQSDMIGSLKGAYRRCSEYIHGSVSTAQMLPTTISLREQTVQEWLSVAATALESVIYCFMVRYFKDLSSIQRQAIEASLEDHFSNRVSIRRLLGLPLEEGAAES